MLDYKDSIKRTIIYHYIGKYINIYPADILMYRLDFILNKNPKTLDRLSKYLEEQVEVKKRDMNFVSDYLSMFAFILDDFVDKPEDI